MKYKYENFIHKGIKSAFVIIALLCNIFCSNHDNNELKPTPGGNKKDTNIVMVSNIQVSNGSGKAIIKFTPPDSGMLFVKAVYNMSNEKERSVIADLYENSIVVDGFSDTLQHEIKIYTVNRSGVMSPAQSVMVHPRLAPINKVFDNLKVVNYFGGYRLTAYNPSDGIVGIVVIRKEESGKFEKEDDKSLYTSEDSIVSVVSDMDASKSYQLGFYVIDQFDNSSDTLFKTIKPLQVQQLDRSNWNVVDVDDVQPGYGGEGKVEHIIDGDPNSYWLTTWDANPRPGPRHYVTIDMGTEHFVTGFKVLGRNNQLEGNPKIVTFKLGHEKGEWDYEETFTLPLDMNSVLLGEVSLSEAVKAKYFKFIVEKSLNDDLFTHTAEVWALGN